MTSLPMFLQLIVVIGLGQNEQDLPALSFPRGRASAGGICIAFSIVAPAFPRNTKFY